jgi:antirestriction protein ArdC
VLEKHDKPQQPQPKQPKEAHKMTSYEVITNQIIEKLNEGIIPWVKPWKTDGWKADGKNVSLFPAFSYSNGKRYNFMNQMLLGFQAGEFATFEQIKKAGGKVKKGEKSSIVAGWIVETKPQEDKDGNVITDEDGNELTKTTFALRYYRVFNILTQVEGLTPKHDWEKVELPENNQETSDEAEKIIKGYLSRVDAPKFEIIKGSNDAYYAPALDLVRVPHISQYDSISEYYGTIFHEFTHSTGSEKRLNRKLVGMSAKARRTTQKRNLSRK